MSNSINRRTFIEFLGKGALVSLLAPSFLTECRNKVFQGISPTFQDGIKLAPGLSYRVVIGWGDPISPNDQFGFNNDYLVYQPLDPANPDDGLLWVNHEYADPRFVSGYTGQGEKTLEQVDQEMYHVGGSILHIRKNTEGLWEVVQGDPMNRRITAHTEIPFLWHEPIAGKTSAMGTLGNCAGGVTPWGTILTCEENYDAYFGERNFETMERVPLEDSDEKWYLHYDNPPEHYGWVVEVDLRTGQSRKLVGLGRCAHECATVKQLADGRVVVYSGDDANDQCVYKFIADRPNSLESGKLYVANLAAGRWELLDHAENPLLREKFASQTEVLVRLREAADLIGGAKLDRPEDIEIDPITGHVLVTLTNNKPKGNFFGSIMKIRETNNDYASLTFESETYLTGGPETGFACPDNMAFDQEGNLWFTSDISGSEMNRNHYKPFGNNGLYLVPRSGAEAGKVIQIASAPNGAEFTGPWFAPDGKTLFLSVQHPGEDSKDASQFTSHWPDGGASAPRPAVIAIQWEV